MKLLGSAGAGGLLAGVTGATPGREPGPKEGEVLVGVTEHADGIEGEVASHVPSDARIVHSNERIRYVAVAFPTDAGAAREAFKERVTDARHVQYAEDNVTFHALDHDGYTPNDPLYDDQYAPQMVHCEGAWETTLGDPSVTVSVVDQGIQYDHPNVEENMDGSVEYYGYDFVEDDSDPYPVNRDENHGTHVGGIAAGATDNGTGHAGISDCSMLSARALDEDGSGSLSDIADAITWSADQGAEVINMSLGGGGYTDTMKNAVSYAQDQGSLQVAAAGNDYGSDVSYPAAYEEVVAVSALDEDGSLAAYSNVGEEIELCAPGSNVLSSVNWDDYDEFSGTSMASPVVAGVAGLTISQWDTNNSDTRSHLKATAEDVGLSAEEQGEGRVDADAAVNTEPGGDGDDDCVDASHWPAGTGMDGYEYIQETDMDGQIAESSADSAYYDFTCPDVVRVEQGGSFDVAVDFDDGGYDGHYGSIHVDWDQNGDWSTADGTAVFENVNDDSVTYTATVDVPSDAPTGGTLARVRLSYDGFDDPDATDEYGEVNDFTVYVEDSDGAECVDAGDWPAGTGMDGYEYIQETDMDGQVVEASGDDAYYDFTCPDVVTVQQGGSFDLAMTFDDGGYDGHYGSVHVDWDQNGDWSTADGTAVFENVAADGTYTATVDVPSDAPTGSTLARVRLSWDEFKAPGATDEYGEVNDFTIVVE